MALYVFLDSAFTEIYTLSLHDALPICEDAIEDVRRRRAALRLELREPGLKLLALNEQRFDFLLSRSEEHTSELQSRRDLVCRLLLEKKKSGPPFLWHQRMAQKGFLIFA